MRAFFSSENLIILLMPPFNLWGTHHNSVLKFSYAKCDETLYYGHWSQGLNSLSPNNGYSCHVWKSHERQLCRWMKQTHSPVITARQSATFLVRRWEWQLHFSNPLEPYHTSPPYWTPSAFTQLSSHLQPSISPLEPHKLQGVFILHHFQLSDHFLQLNFLSLHTLAFL